MYPDRRPRHPREHDLADLLATSAIPDLAHVRSNDHRREATPVFNIAAENTGTNNMETSASRGQVLVRDHCVRCLRACEMRGWKFGGGEAKGKVRRSHGQAQTNICQGLNFCGMRMMTAGTLCNTHIFPSDMSMMTAGTLYNTHICLIICQVGGFE